MQYSKFVRLLGVVVWLCIVCFACPVQAARHCGPLFQLYGINDDLIEKSEIVYDPGYRYFCAKTAPLQYKCSCGIVDTCKPASDPWGRNIGRCGCCPNWLIFIFVIPCIVFLVLIVTVVYIYALKPQWWCEGFPRAVYSVVPRRGPSVPCPAQLPLPDNIFRGYNSADFVNEEPVESQAETNNNNNDGAHATPQTA